MTGKLLIRNSVKTCVKPKTAVMFGTSEYNTTTQSTSKNSTSVTDMKTMSKKSIPLAAPASHLQPASSEIQATPISNAFVHREI